MSDAYDKAKWHYGADDFSPDLAEIQGYVHTGMFYGWLIEHDFFADGFFEGAEHIVEAFRKREATGAGVFEYNDGVLDPSHLSAEGRAFADAYFEFETGHYIRDYESLLCQGLPSMYHVKDSWENYEIVKRRIEKRYEAWKRTGKTDLKEGLLRWFGR